MPVYLIAFSYADGSDGYTAVIAPTEGAALQWFQDWTYKDRADPDPSRRVSENCWIEDSKPLPSNWHTEDSYTGYFGIKDDFDRI